MSEQPKRFVRKKMRSALFRETNLEGASFRDVSLRGAQFQGVDLTGVRMGDVGLRDLTIWTWGYDLAADTLSGFSINGIEIGPLVVAELDKRNPERRIVFEFEDVEGARRAWDVSEGLWDEAIKRAQRLPDGLVGERVDEEFSFIETLEHLIAAVDDYILRTFFDDKAYEGIVLQLSRCKRPLGLGQDLRLAGPGGRALPTTSETLSLDEVVAERSARHAIIGEYVAEISSEEFERLLTVSRSPHVQRVLDAGSGHRTVGHVLRSMLIEQWWHHQYATRDLATLESRVDKSPK